MTPEMKRAIGRLRATRADGAQVTGTAFLVAERFLLTAFHLVGDRAATVARAALVPYKKLHFDPYGTEEAEISVSLVLDCWDAVDDWALLETPIPITGAQPLPMGEVSQWEQEEAPIGASLLFTSWGFPTLARMSGSGVTIDGRVQDRNARYQDAWALELYSDQAAAALGEPLSGLSGAPCIVDGAVVGIIRSNLLAHSAQSGQPAHIVAGKLYACPVATATLQERCAHHLPLLDPIRGLPGLSRHPLPLKPFRYLHWYGADHAEVFFGRNRKVRELYHKIANLDTPSVVLVYGASGVGKSSLLEAGLLPRLSWNFHVLVQRRDAKSTLAQSFDSLFAATQIQEVITKPIVILIDQVEEVFTDPTSDGNRELSALAKRISECLSSSKLPLRILIGFRSEWLANVRKRLEEASIPVSELYIERLTRDEIEEVVQGVVSSSRLRHFYGVSVDHTLPRRIADELLADPQSPVTPMLSIILTRLWDDAKARRPGEQHLSQAAFDEHMRNKLDLNRFMTEQIDEVAVKRGEDVESGLVCDLLYRHSTEYGTAKEVSRLELLQTYYHLARGDDGAYLQGLISELERKSLLFSVDNNESIDLNEPSQPATRLAHDTLAVPVRRALEKSDLPGQRALRILEGRVEDWHSTRSDSSLLDAVSLAAIDRGARGTRGVTLKEDSFIQASRIACTKQGQVRKTLLTLATVAVSIIALAVVLIFVQSRRVKAQNELLAHRVAREEMRKAQDALMRDDVAQIVPATLRVLESAPRTDPIRATAMDLLINTIPRMPQLLVALGPTSAAVLGINRRIVLLRRPNGAVETWDFDRGTRLPCPEAGGNMTEFERMNFLTAPSLSPDERFAAMVVPVDIDNGAQRTRSDRWRVVAWQVGQADLLVDQAFQDTRPHVEWGREDLLLAQTWYPKIGEDRLSGWRLTAKGPPPPFSLVSKNVFSSLEPRSDLSAIVWVVGESGILRYTHVKIDDLVSGREYSAPPPDAIDWAVRSDIGRAGRDFQWDSAGGGFTLGSQSDGKLAHCGPSGCVSPYEKPTKPEDAPFPERLSAPSFTPVTSATDKDGDRLFLSPGGNLLRFPAPQNPHGSSSRYGNKEELLHPAILFSQEDQVLYVNATVYSQSIEVEAKDASTLVTKWKREIPWPGAHADSWIDLAPYGESGVTVTEELSKHRLAILFARDGRPIEHPGSRLIPFNDGANRGVAILEEADSNTRTRCAGPFEGFRSFSRDEKSFLTTSPTGFEVHTTNGPTCDAVARIAVTPGNLSLGIPDDWSIREAIGAVFQEAQEMKINNNNGIDFSLNNGARLHIGTDRSGQTSVEADGRPLILPKGKADSEYLNYVALSGDGKRIATISPYGDIYDARCHEIWVTNEEMASQIAGPTCFYASEQKGMFSSDGTEFYALRRDGTLHVTYAGSEKPQDWQWATVNGFAGLMGFVVTGDGRIVANESSSASTAAAHLRELLSDDVKRGDDVALRVQNALSAWCGNQHCRTGP